MARAGSVTGTGASGIAGKMKQQYGFARGHPGRRYAEVSPGGSLEARHGGFSRKREGSPVEKESQQAFFFVFPGHQEGRNRSV